MEQADKARLKRLEEMIFEIHAFIVMVRAPVLDDAQRDMAVEAFMEGRPQLLELYIEKGGKPPDMETQSIDHAPVQALRASTRQ